MYLYIVFGFNNSLAPYQSFVTKPTRVQLMHSFMELIVVLA
uniref:Uncharacterized protein n=1 Tax=Rhizophora mucronata TaxID=61149 RepID=A0A2P2QYW6_RHIMU